MRREHVGVVDEADAVGDAELAVAHAFANWTISSTRVHLQ